MNPLALLLAALVAAPAFGQAPGGAAPARPRAGALQPGRGDADRGHQDPSDQPRVSDAEVLAELHATNRMEIDAGKLAEDRGSSRAAKELGKTLERDHGQADAKVEELAKRLNVHLDDTALPPRFAGQHAGMRARLEELSGLGGEVFDAAFAQRMAHGHRGALAFLRAVHDRVQDAELKAHLEALGPVLQAHLSAAEALSRPAGEARTDSTTGRMHRAPSIPEDFDSATDTSRQNRRTETERKDDRGGR